MDRDELERLKNTAFKVKESTEKINNGSIYVPDWDHWLSYLFCVDEICTALPKRLEENERMARALGEIEKLSETNINDFKKIRIIRLLIDIGDRARKAREGPRG